MKKTKTCGDCPKWVKGWCVAFAKVMVASALACEYGRRMIRNDYMKRWMRRKRREVEP